MKKLLIVLLILLSTFRLFAKEKYIVAFEKRYSNCILQYYEADKDGMATIIMFEKGYNSIPSEYIISSYNEELLKNFLYYLVENSPKKYPNEYDFSIIKKYEEEHEELVLLEEKTNINSDNTLTKRYCYKLELE